MFLIVAYDIKSNNSTQVLKILRKYLFHVQKSLFEGEITHSNFIKLQNEVLKIIDTSCDSIIYYQVITEKALSISGVNVSNINNIII